MMALLRLTALGSIVAGHHLDDEGPAGRVVEGGDDALHGGERVDDARPCRGSRRPRPRARSDCAIAAAWAMISRRRLSLRSATVPAQAPSSEHGAELTGREQAEGDAGVGQAQHQQGLGDHRQPGPGLGDELAGEEEPEVAHRAASGRCPSRRATCGGSRRRPARGSSLERLEDVERVEQPLAARRVARSARRASSHAVRTLMTSSRCRRPAAVPLTRVTRRSSGSISRVTNPRSSRAATAFVTVGGATFSRAASSPRVMGPRRTMEARAELWVRVSSSLPSWRMPAVEEGDGAPAAGRRGRAREPRGSLFHQTN